MSYPTKAQPNDSGPGTYRFLVASAYLACESALHDANKLHAHVEWLISLATPHLVKHMEEWEQLNQKLLVDEDGNPLPIGSPTPKMARYKQAGFLMQILSEAGVFGRHKSSIDDTKEFLTAAMQERNQDQGEET